MRVDEKARKVYGGDSSKVRFRRFSCVLVVSLRWRCTWNGRRRPEVAVRATFSEEKVGLVYEPQNV